MTKSMSIKIQYSGSDHEFVGRMTAFAGMIPDITKSLEELGLVEAIQGLDTVKFVEDSPSSDRSQYVQSDDDIIVYPLNFKAGDRPDWSIYWAIGARHWSLNISPENKIRWSNMAVEPSKSQASRVLEFFDGTKTFRQAIDSANDAIERLIAVHIANALTKNGIRPVGIAAVNLRSYPPVSDFTSGLRSYSLKPLVSAYGSISCLPDYASAFAEYAVNGGKFMIREKSTNKAFTSLFTKVSNEN